MGKKINIESIVLKQENVLQSLKEYKNGDKVSYLYGEGATLTEGFQLAFASRKEIQSIQAGSISREITWEEMEELSKSKYCKNRDIVKRALEIMKQLETFKTT